MPLRYVEQIRLHGGHTQGITCLAFNDQGSLLASGSLDGTVCVWEPGEAGKPLYTWAGTSSILCLEWYKLKSEEAIFCGLRNDSILSLRILKKRIEVHGFWAYGYPAEKLAARDDYLAVGAQKQASVWRVVEKGPWIEELRIPDPPATSLSNNREILVTGLQWIKKGCKADSDKSSPEGLLFVAYMYHGIVIIDSATWSRVRSIPTSGCIASACVSPNGELFAVSNPPARFDIYQIDGQPDSQTPVHVLVDEFDSSISDSPTPVVFVHDGHALLTGSSSGTPKLWDTKKGVLHHRIPTEAGKRVLAVAATFCLSEEDSALDEFKVALGILDATSSESEIVMCAAVPYDEPVHAMRSWSKKNHSKGSATASVGTWSLALLCATIASALTLFGVTFGGFFS
ncbi:WD40-repeat-containing domain protein [Irpex rosettiformis]|uniref:WD40-repeat-containing domain protein n=1 Tax=Irpex rosettiformis TaxID=378272 RepID=A0ACB8U6G1_9APHY|nr:WD40-repeat-containing domain protein [Irpex rosettiformis]